MYGGRGALTAGGAQAIFGDMWKYEPIASVWTPIVSASAEQPVGRCGFHSDRRAMMRCEVLASWRL